MSIKRTLATTARVLRQLRHDRRSIVLMLIAPSLLVGLFAWLLTDVPGAFDTYGGPIVALFPFVVMFVVTSVTTLRERRSGTLERILTLPTGKGDVIIGYALAFTVMGILQGVVTVSFAIWVCHLTVEGPAWQLMVVAIIDAVTGAGLGLLASAFARTEFQAVQFMPLLVFPQVIIGGLFIPRGEMPGVLEAISNWLPLSYAIDATTAVARGAASADVYAPLAIMGAFLLGFLVLASLTLQRRTP